MLLPKLYKQATPFTGEVNNLKTIKILYTQDRKLHWEKYKRITTIN